MKKNRILSLIVAMIMVCTLLIGAQQECSGGGWTGMRGWIIFDK